MTYSNLLAARQIRAARALLDWSQEDLSAESGISVATIRKLELGHVSRGATIQRIREALQDNGLEFMEPDGVRHSPESIMIYTGPEGAVEFLGDILRTLKKKQVEIIIVCRSGSLLEFASGAEKECFEKFSEIKKQAKASIKCLLGDDTPSPITGAICECRILSRYFFEPAPLYVYGDKLALFDRGSPPRVVVIQSQTIARDLRRQFMSMWEKATALRMIETSAFSKRDKEDSSEL